MTTNNNTKINNFYNNNNDYNLITFSTYKRQSEKQRRSSEIAESKSAQINNNVRTLMKSEINRSQRVHLNRFNALDRRNRMNIARIYRNAHESRKVA
jgi:hypothetical protein